MTHLVCYGILVGLGTVVSFEDWSRRKIRNSLIVLGLAACAAAYLWLLANSLLGRSRMRLWLLGEYFLPLSFYGRSAVHLALSLAAGFALWRTSVWPAGDAKFFLVCAALAALVDPNLPGFPGLLFLVLLINIFVPAGVLFAAESLVIGAARLPSVRSVDAINRLKAWREIAAIRLREAWPHRREYGLLGFNLVAAFVALQAAQRRLTEGAPGVWTTLLVFAGMCLVWRYIALVLRDRRVAAAALAALALWTAHGAWTEGWTVARRLGSAAAATVNFGLFLSLGRAAFYWFIERQSLRELRVEHLAQGTILSDDTRRSLETEEALRGRLERATVDGLTSGEAEALRGWLRGRQPGGYTVYHTIPFAFWILLGTLVTLARRDSVVSALARAAGGDR